MQRFIQSQQKKEKEKEKKTRANFIKPIIHILITFT